MGGEPVKILKVGYNQQDWWEKDGNWVLEQTISM